MGGSPLTFGSDCHLVCLYRKTVVRARGGNYGRFYKCFFAHSLLWQTYKTENFIIIMARCVRERGVPCLFLVIDPLDARRDGGENLVGDGAGGRGDLLEEGCVAEDDHFVTFFAADIGDI